MKKRIALFLVLSSIFISALQPSRRSSTVLTTPVAASPVVQVGTPHVQAQPVKERVGTEPSINQLQAPMERLSDEELRQVVKRSVGEIKRRLAADPKGERRSEAETQAFATELNRESAARLLLLNRKLDGMRKKYL